MIALVLGVAGVVAMVVGFGMDKEQFFRSYLFGFTVWVGLPIGCLGLLLLQHLISGSWGVMIRRVLEAGTKTFWLLILAFIPIALGLKHIYVWAAYPSNEVFKDFMAHKAKYLNSGFFIGRTALYFAFWVLLTVLLSKWSNDQDTSSNSRDEASKMRKLSGPGIVFFCIAVSFASFDWVMSLDPYWGSTIFGLIFLIGWVLLSLTFVVCTMAFLSTRKPLEGLLGPPHFHDWGKLMLAMVMVWAYFNISQYLLIWSANLPEETKWYIGRTTGNWRWFGFFLGIFMFALPFFLLLSRDLKRSWKTLIPVAIGLFFVRMVDIYWLVGPAPRASGGVAGVHHLPYFKISWMDFAALVAFGGIWIAAFIWHLKKRPLLPVNEYRLERAIAHAHKGGH